MIRISRCLLLFIVLLAGCDAHKVGINVTGPDRAVSRTKEIPVVNLPPALRQSNWLGTRGEGSCAYAAMVSGLRWQGRPHTAERIRGRYGNGCSYPMMAAMLEREGVRYAYTTSGDPAWLQWACDTRRGAAIVVQGGAHMVYCVHLDDRYAYCLDSNDTRSFLRYDRDQLLSEWRHSSGWAVTPIYGPAPPMVTK